MADTRTILGDSVAQHMARRDPQVAAGPIALAATDMVTLLIYFDLGLWLLA